MNREEQSERMIRGLREGGAFRGVDGAVELIETHISWVLLAGEFAFKLKKPLRFDFLDFSTVERRRFCCEEEVRLNGRFAPDLYLKVVTVTGDVDHPEIDGPGVVLDYAVKMRRFREEDLLSEVARRGELGAGLIDDLAGVVARNHGTCDRSDANHDFGRPVDVHFWVRDNFAETIPLLASEEEREELGRIERWTDRAYERLESTLAERRRDGFVRECHGDLHLRNIVLLAGKPVMFDCIEFNPALRWIDVMSEVAFLVMDLDDRGFPELAHQFLNRYLQITGDYGGLAVLDYYLVYRAMVRAKVTAIRIREGHLGEGEEAALWKEYRTYEQLASHYTDRHVPVVVLMHGVSGAGKSTLAAKLVAAEGMIQVRSDLERKRLFGFDGGERTGSELGAGIYSSRADAAVYTHLREVVSGLWSAGRSPIVDATFLKRAQREPFLEWARHTGAAVVILDLDAPPDVLRERVARRMKAGSDPSEATVEVLEHQLQSREPFDAEEERIRVAVDSSREIDMADLGAKLRRAGARG